VPESRSVYFFCAPGACDLACPGLLRPSRRRPVRGRAQAHACVPAASPLRWGAGAMPAAAGAAWARLPRRHGASGALRGLLRFWLARRDVASLLVASGTEALGLGASWSPCGSGLRNDRLPLACAARGVTVSHVPDTTAVSLRTLLGEADVLR